MLARKKAQIFLRLSGYDELKDWTNTIMGVREHHPLAESNSICREHFSVTATRLEECFSLWEQTLLSHLEQLHVRLVAHLSQLSVRFFQTFSLLSHSAHTLLELVTNLICFLLQGFQVQLLLPLKQWMHPLILNFDYLFSYGHKLLSG